MAVLVEGISVLIRVRSIEENYPGGWEAFARHVPNQTLCSDSDLARVGFLDPDEVKGYIYTMGKKGLAYLIAGKPQDIVVVDQQCGPMVDCEWLEFARISHGDSGGRMAVACLFEGPRIAHGIHMPGKNMQVATPPGWRFEGSLSDKFTYVPEGDCPNH